MSGTTSERPFGAAPNAVDEKCRPGMISAGRHDGTLPGKLPIPGRRSAPTGKLGGMKIGPPSASWRRLANGRGRTIFSISIPIASGLLTKSMVSKRAAAFRACPPPSGVSGGTIIASPGGLKSAESARAVAEGVGYNDTGGATRASFGQGIEEEIYRPVRVGAIRIFDPFGASAPAEPEVTRRITQIDASPRP